MIKDKELQELFGLLTEECAEVIQALSKAKRFGLDNVYKGKSNKTHLVQEVGDVVALIMIISAKYPEVMNDLSLASAVKKKIAKLKTYHDFLKDFEIHDGQDSNI